ncbi:MAG: DNA primase, partial [Gillisia sp.]
YHLHDWQRKDITVKTKEMSISRLVNETILALRRFLINQKINELSSVIQKKEPEDSRETLEDIMDYQTLKKMLSNKLNRVM